MQLSRKLLQHLHPLSLDAVLHLILTLGSRCSRTTRIREDVNKRRAHHVTKECICLHEQLICLSRESHDHIDSEEHLRASWDLRALPDVLNLMCKCSSVITTSHLLQDGVASRLKRNVIMRQELGA